MEFTRTAFLNGKTIKSLIYSEDTRASLSNYVLKYNFTKDNSNRLVKLINDSPNFPIEAWLYYEDKVRPRFNSTCAVFPMANNVRVHNENWQLQDTSYGEIQLFGSYLDDRDSDTMNPSIRILGLMKTSFIGKLYCQIWYKHQLYPIITPIYESLILWNPQWRMIPKNMLNAYLFSCKIPNIYKKYVPFSVSLVEHECDIASNNLNVIYKKTIYDKNNFAVCVKGLSITDSSYSVKMVEWLELLFILGVEKVYIYEYELTSTIRNVLDYYEKQSKVKVHKLHLPKNYQSIQGFHNKIINENSIEKLFLEMIPYNDCFYKNMYNYKYIVLLDFDEIIVSRKFDNWSQLVTNSLKQISYQNRTVNTPTTLCARNVYFFKEDNLTNQAPNFMQMLQRRHRSTLYSSPGDFVKCFHDTNQTLSLHNHFPFNCLKKCYFYIFNVELAQLNHYRDECQPPTDKNSCDKYYKSNLTEDDIVWKYKDNLINNTIQVLSTLGFF